jgi:signal transduction histidine kinase
LANAVKYRSERRVEIHISVTDDPTAWTFAVRDNGIGIPAEYHQRVFDAFMRLHTQDEIPGTGIGLALCRRIVEHHGGRIWVESQPREGSTFYFTLPKHVNGSAEQK